MATKRPLEISFTAQRPGYLEIRLSQLLHLRRVDIHISPAHGYISREEDSPVLAVLALVLEDRELRVTDSTVKQHEVHIAHSSSNDNEAIQRIVQERLTAAGIELIVVEGDPRPL